MMASTVADNVSTGVAPLAANPSRKSLCLRARPWMLASGHTYNTLLLSALLERYRVAGDEKAITLLRKISPVAWQHVHFLGRYLFRGSRQPIDLVALLADVALRLTIGIHSKSKISRVWAYNPYHPLLIVLRQEFFRYNRRICKYNHFCFQHICGSREWIYLDKSPNQ